MAAALLLRPQGRRGELLAEASGPLELFTPGKMFALAPTPASPAQPVVAVELESAWEPTGRNAGRLVVKLKGTDSITAAEAIAGQQLLLRVDQLPALEEGTYRVRDLTGCSLFDGDILVGTVLDLQFPVAPDGRTRLEEAPDLLVVQPLTSENTGDASLAEKTIDAGASRASTTGPNRAPDAAPEPVLVPFVRAWLLEVDIPGKRLRMQLPPGLFDAAE